MFSPTFFSTASQDLQVTDDFSNIPQKPYTHNNIDDDSGFFFNFDNISFDMPLSVSSTPETVISLDPSLLDSQPCLINDPINSDELQPSLVSMQDPNGLQFTFTDPIFVDQQPASNQDMHDFTNFYSIGIQPDYMSAESHALTHALTQKSYLEALVMKMAAQNTAVISSGNIMGPMPIPAISKPSSHHPYKRSRVEYENASDTIISEIEAIDFEDVTVLEMKKLLRRCGLNATGRKEELANKLKNELVLLKKSRDFTSSGKKRMSHSQQQQHWMSLKH